MPLRSEAQAGPSTRPVLWCAIYQVVGKHVTDNYHLLHKFVQKLQQLFCNFCESMGHDECNYRSYEIMMDTMPAYRLYVETQPSDQGSLWIKALGEREEEFRGMDEADVEEALVEDANK